LAAARAPLHWQRAGRALVAALLRRRPSLQASMPRSCFCAAGVDAFKPMGSCGRGSRRQSSREACWEPCADGRARVRRRRCRCCRPGQRVCACEATSQARGPRRAVWRPVRLAPGGRRQRLCRTPQRVLGLYVSVHRGPDGVLVDSAELGGCPPPMKVRTPGRAAAAPAQRPRAPRPGPRCACHPAACRRLLLTVRSNGAAAPAAEGQRLLRRHPRQTADYARALHRRRAIRRARLRVLRSAARAAARRLRARSVSMTRACTHSTCIHIRCLYHI
jgi:hypothetical protein